MLKKCKIPNNSIVGACSVITKAFFEEYTVLCGNPAKVVSHNKDWKRENSYESETNDIMHDWREK